MRDSRWSSLRVTAPPAPFWAGPQGYYASDLHKNTSSATASAGQKSAERAIAATPAVGAGSHEQVQNLIAAGRGPEKFDRPKMLTFQLFNRAIPVPNNIQHARA